MEGGLPGTPRASPPKAVVDTSPLLNSLEQNKESLKVKLMLRRPVDQLVAQGIMPPLKAPPAFHGQRRQLERAKTGDMLKAKIQQRPPRQELERRHILESDPAHVDPSLAEKQRMLKKARLADQLNDQLSHRPGPLELIQKNILHTEEPIEHAVKAGHIPYKATCEGQLNRPQHPISYINPEDDSQSSEDNLVSPGPSDVIETAAKSAGIVVSLIPATEGTVVVTTATPILTNKDNCSELVFTPLIQNRSAASPASLVSSTSTLSPLSSVASPVPSIVSQPTTPIPPPLPTIPYATRPTKCDAPGKDKNRKKSKSKSTPKTRTIKFHEYKGPPSAQKSSSANNNNNGESSYDLLLQQQTLLLQFQLQLQHKYPQIILPASQKVQNEASAANMNNPLPSPASSTTSESTTTSTRLIGKLEDMKVSDLKAELKRRNLPVSGSKPQLIERLKPFLGDLHITQHPDSTTSSKSLSEDVQHNSPVMQHSDIGSPQASSIDDMEAMDTINPMSPLPQPMQVQCIDSVEIQEDIVKKQQKQIEELQRELTLSQLKLKAVTTAEPKAQLIALQKHLQARQQQQQLVEQIQMNNLKARQEQEQQQRIQQQQHVAFQNQKNLTGGLVLTDASLLNHLVQGSKKLSNGHNRTNSLPNFLHGIVTPVISPPEVKEEIEEEVKPPPLYEEATKQIKKEKNNVKSQIVDDVLEILIKNGELPPSAAQDPSTPNSAGTRSVEPVFSPPQQQQPTDNNVPEPVLNIDPDFLGCPLDNMDINQLVMDLAHPSADGNQNIEHDSVPMDTDEWLESLLPNDNQNSNQNVMVTQDSGIGGYDPLLGIAQDPFDPFCLEDFRSPPDVHASLSWDYA